MRFLYFGDRHYTTKQPPNRVDDFIDTCNKKDDEIIALGNKYNVSAFLQPGDFFNEKEINGENEIIKKIINKWNMPTFTNLKRNGSDESQIISTINNNIPLIGIAGNHDLIGNSLDTLPDTTLGLFSSLGLINLVSKDNPIYFTTEDGLKVAITGTSYHLHQDEKEYIDDYIVKEKLGDVHIHIVHGMLSDKDLGKLIKHTTIDEIKSTKADITLCGHNHIGFGIIEIDNKYFINIGSVTRFTGDFKEMTRRPSVAIIDISKKGINIEKIALSTAKEASEVIDRSMIDEEKDKKKAIERFRKEAESMKTKTKPDMSDFVEQIATNKGIPDEIKNDILDRLVEKEKENSKIKTSCKKTYIKKIILENFQSHKYSVFELSENFNVFIGESNQGKSSVLRALYWVYENKPSGKDFIRRGEEFAKVSIELSDGTIVNRFIEAKKNGKNGYEIISPEGEIESGNTKLLEKVQKILSFNDFYIDKKLSLPVNFYKQGDPWYLIGKNLTNTDKARVIGALSGTNIADAVVRDLDSENNKSLVAYKISRQKADDLKKEIDSYSYIETLEKNEQKIKLVLDKYEELSKLNEKLNILRDTYNQLINNLRNKNDILNKLDKVIESRDLLNKIYKKSHQYDLLTSSKKSYDNFNLKLQSQKDILDKLKNVKTAIESLETLTILDGMKNILIDNKEKIDKYKKEIKKHDEIIEKTKDIDLIGYSCRTMRTLEMEYVENLNIKSKLNDLIKKKDALIKSIFEKNEILTKLNNLTTINNNISKIKDNEIVLEKIKDRKDKYIQEKKKFDLICDKIDLDNKNLLKCKEEYKAVLKETNICPICKEPLNEHKINELVK